MGQRGPAPAQGLPAQRSRRFPLGALALALWAAIPPFVGPALHVARRVEIADHVVPAGLIAMISGFTIALGGRRAVGTDTVGLWAGCMVTLAGLWMTTTHVPLLAQTLDHRAPVAAALWHTAPGIIVLVFGASWALHANRSATDHAERPDVPAASS